MSVKLKTGVSARLPLGTVAPAYLYKHWTPNLLDQTTPATTGSTSPSAGCIVGVLPANSMPLECIVRITSGLTTGKIKIGTTADLSTVASTGDVTSATTGTYVTDRYMGTYSTVDLTFYAVTDSSGAGAGEADIWISYLPYIPST